METTSRRSILITAVLALCLAMSMSLYYSYKRKQALRGGGYSAQSFDKRAMPPYMKRSDEQDSHKEKRGGWGSALLPVYTIGVLLYVIYIAGKIIQRKFTHVNAHKPHGLVKRKQFKIKRDRKAKLTMDEVRELEKQLLETEAAIQQIFDQTNQAMAATAEIFDESQSSSNEAPSVSHHISARSISSSDTDGDITRDTQTVTLVKRTRRKKARKLHHKTANEKHEDSGSAEEGLDTNSTGISSDICQSDGESQTNQTDLKMHLQNTDAIEATGSKSGESKCSKLGT